MKKFIKITTLVLASVLLSACFKRDTMENISVNVTVYPIEYITNLLYGESGTIQSIYPDGIKISDYQLTDKQIQSFSKDRLFIFIGITDEKNYAVDMLNKNKNLLIIDASQGMSIDYGVEEIWLDPSNFLMLAQNIRTGFKEYLTDPYLKLEIDKNYDALKLAVSEIDAELKLVADSSSNTTIVVGNKLFKFLEKYNFNVISLDEESDVTDKTIANVKQLINEGKIKYIFLKDDEEPNNIVDSLLAENKSIQILSLNSISNITTKDRSDKKNYITIMRENIDQLKKEVLK